MTNYLLCCFVLFLQSVFHHLCFMRFIFIWPIKEWHVLFYNLLKTVSQIELEYKLCCTENNDYAWNLKINLILSCRIVYSIDILSCFVLDVAAPLKNNHLAKLGQLSFVIFFLKLQVDKEARKDKKWNLKTPNVCNFILLQKQALYEEKVKFFFFVRSPIFILWNFLQQFLERS